VSAWKKRDVRDIRASHVNDILDALVEAGKPSEANHALGVIKTLFGWCSDRDMITVSPCAKIKKPAKHGSRSRALSESELRRLWALLEGEGYPFGTMTKLLLLTGQRRGEVTQMRWSQLDLAARTWLIPTELSKNGREHLVPLSDHALAVIASIGRAGNDLVFPAHGNVENVFSGFTRAKNRLDRLSGLKDWTLHDLRRTTATHLGKLGTPPHVIERVLNHVSGSFAGVAGVYNRHPYFEEMRAALQVWGERLATQASDTHDAAPEPHAPLEA
jgi:integrase